MIFTTIGKHSICVDIVDLPHLRLKIGQLFPPCLKPDGEIDTTHFHRSYGHVNENSLLHDAAE